MVSWFVSHWTPLLYCCKLVPSAVVVVTAVERVDWALGELRLFANSLFERQKGLTNSNLYTQLDPFASQMTT